MFQERDVKLTPQQYLNQRLKNKDTRFEQCTPYVFASAAYLEEKQMERNIGVSFRKGKVDGLKDQISRIHGPNWDAKASKSLLHVFSEFKQGLASPD